MPHPIKKLGELSNTPLFDLYISDIDVTTGNLQDYKKSEKLKVIIKDVKEEKLFAELSFGSEEKNCSTHTVENKRAWRKRWELTNKKTFPYQENY